MEAQGEFNPILKLECYIMLDNIQIYKIVTQASYIVSNHLTPRHHFNMI